MHAWHIPVVLAAALAGAFCRRIYPSQSDHGHGPHGTGRGMIRNVKRAAQLAMPLVGDSHPPTHVHAESASPRLSHARGHHAQARPLQCVPTAFLRAEL